MKGIIHTITIEVITPYKDKAKSVENAINTALDEGPGVDWGQWMVGGAIVTKSVITDIEE